MCDFAGKLIALLDQELAEDDAAAVKRHLQGCPECRRRFEEYRHMSDAFDRYCDACCEAVAVSQPRGEFRRRVLAISGVAVAAAVAMFFLFPLRWRVQPGAAPIAPVVDVTKTLLPQADAAQPISSEVRPIARSKRQKGTEQVKQKATERQSVEPGWLASEPAVEIAIPADAIFPPGAVPEGVGFTADVMIAPDGSAQQIRLRPQLTEFERRATRP